MKTTIIIQPLHPQLVHFLAFVVQAHVYCIMSVSAALDRNLKELFWTLQWLWAWSCVSCSKTTQCNHCSLSASVHWFLQYAMQWEWSVNHKGSHFLTCIAVVQVCNTRIKRHCWHVLLIDYGTWHKLIITHAFLAVCIYAKVRTSGKDLVFALVGIDLEWVQSWNVVSDVAITEAESAHHICVTKHVIMHLDECLVNLKQVCFVQMPYVLTIFIQNKSLQNTRR